MTAAAFADRIRDAATVILLDRDAPGGPSVLMGMRGAAAAFMPSKYVFPGGAVDPEDAALPATPVLGDACRVRLNAEPRMDSDVTPDALATAALRELVEETGLVMAPDRPASLIFVFRAVTPPGRTRRFDARFFLIDARDVAGDRCDFSSACVELSHLHWVSLAEARALDLPFITEVVLAEIEELARAARDAPLMPPATVPFFDNRDGEPRFVQLS
ncbi:MAG TPA: NUDIX hydrolase [Paracoccus sp. (in: a-proteobacteria)]|nr:NUDIX hydrolase [Paracoccus sp. (in: a-proteobacteria)]